VAKTWLDDCCEDHDECSNTSDSEWRTPTRLIDVGKDPNSVLKLVQLTSHVKWVALSHCWGANHEETLKLTRSNINEMLEGFHVKKLPQLFKDCVTVTRKLGVRYLWIDSLCIIQGCPDDWAYEASRMGDVYRGSYFTIAAVSAPGNHASLFSKRHPLMMQKCLAEKTVDGQVTSIGIDSSMLYHEPLYKRGWVLQERLLAPRTLEYCSTGIGWRCRETVLRVDDAIQKAHSFGLTSSWENLLSLRAHKLSRLAPRSGQFHWTRILNAYNTADLSFEKDRPYAVKGIMATLEKETGLRVVAGVVQEFLPVALLWRVPEDGKLPDNKGVSYYTFESWKHSLAHSPSWSCAFRHRHIDYTPYETSTAEAKVKFADEPIHALEIKGNTLGRIVLQPISSIHNDSTWPSSRVTNPQNNIEERAGENANHALNSKKVSIFIPSFHSSPVMLHHVISRWVSISDVIPFFGLLLSLDFILHERMEVEFVLLSFNEEIKPFNRAAGNGLVLAKIGPDNDFWTRMGVFSMPGSAIESGRLLLAFSEKNEFLVR
jgi:hypothetical protein